MLSVFVYQKSFYRLIQSIYDFGLSLAFYFCELFDIGHSIKPFTSNIFTGKLGSSSSALPGTTREVSYVFKMFFSLFFSGTNYRAYNLYLSSKLSIYLKLLTFFLLLVVFGFKKIFSFVEEQNNDYNKDSKPFSLYKKISAKVFYPIYLWLKILFAFIVEYKYIFVCLFLWVYNFNIFAIVFNLFGYYFCLAVSGFSLILFIQDMIIDFRILFSTVPLIVWIVIVIAFLFIIRKSIAISRLRHCENKNKGYINSLDIVTLTCGTMGKKKTTDITDMALSQDVLFRSKALELMQECDAEFPNFPWVVFELELKCLMSEHQIYNLATIKRYIYRVQRTFELIHTNPNCRGKYDSFYHKFENSCYGYDFERYGLFVNNGLKNVYLFDTLKEYAQLYFIYVCNSVLCYSNYSIRFDSVLSDSGNLPMWNNDFFAKSVDSSEDSTKFSKVLDFDMLRLGRKMVDNNINKDCFEFGLVVITEVGKERGNNLENKEVKKKDEGANSKKDMFNKWLKMVRHSATVRNFPFVKVFMDEQRAESLGADARDLATVLDIKTTSEKKLFLPFFFIEELIYDFVKKNIASKYLEYRYNRADNTLRMYLLHNLLAKFNQYYTKQYNLYGCYTLGIQMSSGSSVAGGTRGDLGDKKYYLMPKKIYSERFATNCHAGFYERKAVKSKVGIADVEEYSSLVPSYRELNAQHSYFIRDIVESFEGIKNTELKEEEKVTYRYR